MGDAETIEATGEATVEVTSEIQTRVQRAASEGRLPTEAPSRPRTRGQHELRTREDFEKASEAFEQQKQFKSPMPAERSIMGSACKVLIDGTWLSVCLGVEYHLSLEGPLGIKLTVDKVNSAWEKLILDPEKKDERYDITVMYDDRCQPNPERLTFADAELKVVSGGYKHGELVVQDAIFLCPAGAALTEAIDEKSARKPEDMVDLWEVLNG